VLCTYKWVVQGSNLSQSTTYEKVFHDITQSFQALPKMVPQIRAWPLLSTFFPIRYLIIIIPPDPYHCQKSIINEMAQMCVSETVRTHGHQCHLPALDEGEHPVSKFNNFTHGERVPHYPPNWKLGGPQNCWSKFFYVEKNFWPLAASTISWLSSPHTNHYQKYPNPVPVNSTMHTYCTLLDSCALL
jgi:hypothetical protein